MKKRAGTAGRFLRDGTVMALVNLLTRSVLVGFNSWMAGVIGAEGMGLLSLVSGVMGLAVTVATSGVYLAAVRLSAGSLEAGRSTAGILRACLLYSLLFGCSAALLVGAFSVPLGTVVLGDARTVPALRAMAVSLPLISLSASFSGYFTGVRQVWKSALVTVTEQAVKIGLTAAGLLFFRDAGLDFAALTVMAATAAANAVSLLLSAVLYRIRRPGGNKIREPLRKEFSAVAETALPIGIGSYARQGLVSAEHVAIPWGLRKAGASSGDALASYGILHGMVLPLVLYPASVPQSFSGLLVPEIAARQTAGDRAGIRRVTERVVRVALLYAIGVAAVLAGFSGELGEGLYRSAAAGAQIRILAPLVPVMYVDSTVDAVLKGLGEQVSCMKVNLLDASVSLLLVLILVPRLGVNGYLITIFVCEIMNTALSLSHLIGKTGCRISFWRAGLLPMLCGAAAVAVARLSASLPLPVVGSNAAVTVALAAVTYLLLLVLTGCLRMKKQTPEKRLPQRSVAMKAHVNKSLAPEPRPHDSPANESLTPSARSHGSPAGRR